MTLYSLVNHRTVDAEEAVVYYDFRVTYIASAFDGVALTSFSSNERPANEALIEVTLGQQVQVTVTN